MSTQVDLKASMLAERQARRDRGPNIAQRVVNFVHSSTQHVIAGLPSTDNRTYELRLAACETCDLNGGPPGYPYCTHPTCGCHMRIKAGWDEQRCPHPNGDKWLDIPLMTVNQTVKSNEGKKGCCGS